MSKLNLPPFYVGQKVVCVDDNIEYYNGPIYTSPNPIYDVVYTVRHIHYDDGIWWIHLTELSTEDSFSSDGFAPIQEAPAPLLTFEQIKQTEKEEILILN